MLGVMGSDKAAADANIVIINLDGPGEGLNDPTPASPVGGNKGKTLGAQRLIAFQHAAEIWGDTLDSNVTIRVQAAFNPLAPESWEALAPSRHPATSRASGNFQGSSLPTRGTARPWPTSALASTSNRAPTTSMPNSAAISISTWASTTSTEQLRISWRYCCTSSGHGLNFQMFYNRSNGSPLPGHTDIYARNLFDRSFGLTWPEMSNSQAGVSAINFGNLVWNGATVTAAVPAVLVLGNPQVDVLSPSTIARTYQFGTAAFGPPVGSPDVTDPVVAAQDAADTTGPATTDGCSAFTNATAIALATSHWLSAAPAASR